MERTLDVVEKMVDERDSNPRPPHCERGKIGSEQEFVDPQ